MRQMTMITEAKAESCAKQLLPFGFTDFCNAVNEALTPSPEGT